MLCLLQYPGLFRVITCNLNYTLGWLDQRGVGCCDLPFYARGTLGHSYIWRNAMHTVRYYRLIRTVRPVRQSYRMYGTIHALKLLPSQSAVSMHHSKRVSE